MPHAISPPVGLTSVKQLPGRFVRITSSRALGLWHENAVRLNREWQAQPEWMRERDAKFFTGAAAHNRWPALGQFTCRAIVGGRRCSRITIIETGHQRCLKHAGPTAARAYRENCRKLFESGRLPAAKWFKDEERRMRTRIRDRQRRKRDGWLLPGLTLRFPSGIEARFRGDAALVLGGQSWDQVPDYHRDQLRWAWRKFALDRQKPTAWDAKSRAIVLDLASRGPVDADDLAHATGHETHVLFVERRCTAFEWRSKVSEAEIERALAAPAEVQKAILRRGRDQRPKGAASDQGGGHRPARARATTETSEAETDRLLLLHGRDLRAVLAQVPEPRWLKVLRAYDGYARNPTGQTHRAWMAARSVASI